MKNFYIFLDFDGTMQDIEFIKQLHNFGVRKNITKIFKPESINALNFLIDNLCKDFNVVLVISSTWRRNMKETVYYLNKNNVHLNKINKIDKTGYFYDENNINHRDEEIKQYLKEKKENKNYVAIDDEAMMFDLPNLNKIITNIKDGALTLDQAKKWYQNFIKFNEEMQK